MVRKVVAHAPCSVLIAPRGAQMWTRRVLVGIDPQAPDAAMLALAAALAAECGLPLRVLCVAANEAGAARAPSRRWRRALQQARAARAAPSMARCASVGRTRQLIAAAAATAVPTCW